MTITIREVRDAQDKKLFLRMPEPLYSDDPSYIAPLELERSEAWSPKHPFFAHASWQRWLAVQDGQVVGRISAQIEQLRQERYGDNTGYFGLFESTDDLQVAAALCEVAENWLRDAGMQRVMGPFNLGVNQELGILVDGFETPPYFMMGHNPHYYDGLLQQTGYTGEQNLLAYELPAQYNEPPVLRRILDRMDKRLRVRPFDKRNKQRDLETLRDIFNDAWSDNWSFVPFTEAEFADLGQMLLMLIPTDFVQFAEVDGEPVAFSVLLPNLNEMFSDLNGRLLPTGWAKVLWRFFTDYPKTGRVPLMGVRKKHQHTRLGPALAYAVIYALREPAKRKGIATVELSWILEDNKGMRNIIETLGGTVSKRYRMYSKSLSQ